MAVSESSRIVISAILCILPALFGQEQQLPEVSIRALKPNGVVVSMKDIPNMNYFEFQGKVNDELQFGESGDISIDVSKPTNGFWTGQNENVVLKVGDVIHYYVHIGIKRKPGYDRMNLMYVVRELFDDNQQSSPVTTATPVVTTHTPIFTTSAPRTECRKTITQVNSRLFGPMQSICSNQIIFEDDFTTLRKNYWTVEQYIPFKPDYPFVSYQRPMVSVQDGILRIEPRLQETMEGFDSSTIISGKLDLSIGCTRAGFCVEQSGGPQILRPIASGRITSNNAFSFKYGFIDVRAKVPQGDWLYPDILLESLSKTYGSEDERVLRIAGVRGNVVLLQGAEDYGNKVLYGGPLIDIDCRNNFLVKKISTEEWGNDFHNYSVSWTPELITLFVDGEEWGRVIPTFDGLRTKLTKDTCAPLRNLLKSDMPPFDDFFGITLGVSAGGIMEFPDNVLSGTVSKPWKNHESKARLKFFRNINIWSGTWTQPALLVDYIRVRAL